MAVIDCRQRRQSLPAVLRRLCSKTGGTRLLDHVLAVLPCSLRLLMLKDGWLAKEKERLFVTAKTIITRPVFKDVSSRKLPLIMLASCKMLSWVQHERACCAFQLLHSVQGRFQDLMRSEHCIQRSSHYCSSMPVVHLTQTSLLFKVSR